MEQFKNLLLRSQQSLKKNIILTRQGELCVAGAQQFKTLWTRDFCFAVPGLVKIHQQDLVKRQLLLILSYKRNDALLPRGLDVTSPKLRVVSALFSRPCLTDKLFHYQNELRPEYLGEHKTIAFDSNVLWARAVFQYTLLTQDLAFLNSLKEDIKKILFFYKKFQTSEGLFLQDSFSDWMDSLKRRGAHLYFHVLLYQVLKMAEEAHIDCPWSSQQLLDVIQKNWFQAEQWRRESLESLLWCLELKVGPQADLIKHILQWQLGVPHHLQSPSEVSWSTWIVGLGHYHDNYAWTWLTAETARVIRPYDPRKAEQALDELEQLVIKNEDVPEIYYPGSAQMVKTLLYRSEKPFTWGAAKIIECLG